MSIMRDVRSRILVLGVGFSALVVLFALLAAQHVLATPYASTSNTLAKIVDRHVRTLAAKAELDAAQARARATRKDWFPTLGLKASGGGERLKKPEIATTRERFGELDLSLNQKVWDFGVTRAKISKADLQYERARVKLVNTRQLLLLEALTALLDIGKARQVLKFSERSTANIKKQTGMEEAAVSAGSGYTTDVLQAKAQLAGARARQIGARRSLIDAQSRSRVVFGDGVHFQGGRIHGRKIVLPVRNMPASLFEALKTARQYNPELRLARLRVSIAKSDTDRVRADEFGGDLNLVLEKKYKENVSGLRGRQEDTVGKLEFTYKFNTGLSAFDELDAARSDTRSAHFALSDTQRKIRAKIRTSWTLFKTSRLVLEAKREQASISKAFLVLARKERKLGRRSLIDVLSGETSLINAESDAAAAKADLIISAYALLSAMGVLNDSLVVAR